ncbi:MAG: hypothetical protein NZM43_13705 [Saprospiraceae bacterium]|nr:hypothetical protein [Saprospiraceae bacterium]MDW8485370.1 hypothetical protein [Saprospiraceae bacterium]
MKFVNLTPHEVKILKGNEVVLSIPPTEPAARATQKYEDRAEVNGIPVWAPTYGEVVNLPPAEEGTFYIVSMIVAQAERGRRDLLVPDSGRAIRDSAGNIIGVPGFLTFSRK